ncbi:hypothetical protein P3T76_008773 [Phytophthora citrophthora]|uniref:Uncharacterized protein n=1 Tax=Phytophthora citrophthora TaxID=4793 RepID=A0AAD9GIV8_9STRA|nr:hypothetical protein P3T76_008773 [Phytophthora citrophthora]
MSQFVVLLIRDWYKKVYDELVVKYGKKEENKKENKETEKKEKEKKETEKKEKEVKFNGTPVEGVLYETPPPKTTGVSAELPKNTTVCLTAPSSS